MRLTSFGFRVHRSGGTPPGANTAGIPPVWMIYIVVADLDASLAQCRARGGEVVGEPREMGGVGRFAFIRDPAGAPCALFEAA